MALTILQQGKRKNYLNGLFFIAIVAAILWFGKSYLVKPAPAPPSPPKEKTIEINLQVLENQNVKDLKEFEEIVSYKEKVGRENPFLPY